MLTAVLDQSNWVSSDPASNGGSDGYYNHRGQSFTVGTAGLLESVEVMVRGEMSLQLYETNSQGLPAKFLGAVSADTGTIGPGGVRLLELFRYDVSGLGINVRAGDTYAFALQGSGHVGWSSAFYGGGSYVYQRLYPYKPDGSYGSTPWTKYENSPELSFRTWVLPNQAPLSVALSQTSIPEAANPGAVVGQFSTTDPDGSEAFTYELVAGEGAFDNAAFEIHGNQLRSLQSFDYETKSSYSIRVRSTDAGGLFAEEWFSISVTDINEAPVDIWLSGGRVAENTEAGEIVGTLSTADEDLGDSFHYELVSGEGDSGNGVFEVVGSTVRTRAILDFETQDSFSIRVRSTDSSGLSVEKAKVIFVEDLHEPPASFDPYGFDRFIIEAFQAGSTLDVDDIKLIDLQSQEIVYANDFNAGSIDGLTLVHWKDASYGKPPVAEPVFDATKTRVVDGRLRLETTGFRQNGAGGYDSRSWLVLNDPLPADFELSFLVYKHQWAGHAHIFVIPPNTEPLQDYGATAGVAGGFFTNIQGGQINTIQAVTPAGVTRLRSAPGTSGPYLSTDVRYRIVKVGSSLSVYVQDALLGSTAALSPVNAIHAPTSLGLSGGSVAENLPAGSVVGVLSTTDADVSDSFSYNLVPGRGDGDNAAFQIKDGVLQTTASFDYEAKDAYSIRVRSTDRSGFFLEKSFTISVADVVEDWSLEQEAGEISVDSGARSGSSRLVKRGQGTLILEQANSHSGGIVVEAGELVVRDPAAIGSGTLQVLPGALIRLDVGAKQVQLTRLVLEPGGTLDLATGAVSLNPGSYELASVRGLIASARGAGGWSGSGITSSIIQPGSFREIGYHVSPDGSLVVGYAAAGDANMDGVVNVLDLISMSAAGKLGGAGANSHWWEGDFNYDGFANVNDLISVLSSGLYRRPSYVTADARGATMAGSPALLSSAGVTLTGSSVAEIRSDQPAAVPFAVAVRAPEPRRIDPFSWSVMANQGEFEKPRSRMAVRWQMVGG